MIDKRHILVEIARIAAANGGRAPGREKFKRETGIKMSDWYPDYWLRWGDALQEAGFAPNKLQTALSDDIICEKYASLVRALGRLPVYGELVRATKKDASFPSKGVFQRFGGKKQLVGAVAEFCRTHEGYEEVLELCLDFGRSSAADSTIERVSHVKVPTGFVYLIKSGRHYKIGRTGSLGRREWELGIKIPVPPKTIHSIETDDPVGVEVYWHRRFNDKRGEGEWFELSPEDVAAFKRWKRLV